jgi:DNA-binding response OmpR family regulator
MEKVLCVDDDPTLLSFYQLELSDGAYEVILAGDGILCSTASPLTPPSSIPSGWYSNMS